MKLLHAADLHLDSPLRGLERYEGAPVERLRGATRRALRNLVDHALEEEVALLLLAGDLYDGDWRDYSTGLFFAAQMSRLRQGDVRVVWIRGNHDAASRVTRHLELPDNTFELSHHHPETRVFEDLGLAVHGQGFPTAAVREDLSAAYPPPRPGLLNFGLLHTSADGRPGHQPYAPCSVEALVHKGYDYWALGHIHQREVLREEPWVVFPGNLQGRHARETGPKGATLITVEEGRITAVEHRVLDAARWAVVAVDAGGAETPEEVVERARDALDEALAEADGRPLAARLEIASATAAHAALKADEERWRSALRAAATDLGGDELWLEKVRFRTRPEADLAGLEERDDAAGQLVRALHRLRDDGEALAALVAGAGEFEELRRKLPAAARRGEDGLRLDDPAYLRQLLAGAEDLLLPRLLAAGGRDGE